VHPIFFKLPPVFPEINTNFFPLSMLCIIAFLIMGLWYPEGNNWSSYGYIGLEFILIGIIVLMSNATVRLFPPLLLIMVIRGCLSFNLIGSLVVAIFSLGWFFTSLYFTVFKHINSNNIQQLSAILPPRIEPEIIAQIKSNEEQLKFLITLMATNISFFFCLISLFVFLLVNALKSEYLSQLKLRQVNQQLREYALLIEDRAMLQERNRIAREIHDSLGHSLTAQNIQLANALMYLQSDYKRTEDFLLEAKQLTSNALKEVRQSVSTLRSDPLQGKLLTVAIADLIKDCEYRTEITFNYQTNLTKTISREITTAVYRIVQEALTNMLKHAEATEVNIFLKIIGQYVQLTITDDGIGFDPQENTTGFGIQGMRERTTALGGEFQIESMLTKGCKITVIIPLFRATLDSNI
ncbi:MAG: sensor histidine kinase, partial [Cyanobacteria bacterium P01_G01_bin.49]